MKDTKYKILAYFDNQSYQKLFNEVNSDYAENLQILLHNLSLFSYDVLIIGVILYKENISNIISAIRKITQIPIIILTDASSLLCMSWKKELIYAGADCVTGICCLYVFSGASVYLMLWSDMETVSIPLKFFVYGNPMYYWMNFSSCRTMGIIEHLPFYFIGCISLLIVGGLIMIRKEIK